MPGTEQGDRDMMVGRADKMPVLTQSVERLPEKTNHIYK